jgi:hypothetical protein
MVWCSEPFLKWVCSVDADHVFRQRGIRLAGRGPSRYSSLGDAGGRRSYQRFDELANKCLIYGATDAIAFISYSGIAFVQHRPTDVWLAETLDADIATGPPSTLRIGGSTERPITIGAAMNRVANRLTEVLRAMPARQRSDGLTLQLVGWKWRRRRMFEMPIMWHITNRGHGGETTIYRLPRYWGWERHQARADAIGNRRTNPTQRFQRRVAGLTDLPADLAEQLLVETIREASTDRSTGGSIGADCISTVFGLSDAKARVRYLPASPSHATYDAYSPWVVVPGWAPARPRFSQADSFLRYISAVWRWHSSVPSPQARLVSRAAWARFNDRARPNIDWPP